MAKTGMAIFTVLITLVVILVIYTLMVMLIWNNILVQKFPSSNIRKLDFWEALALAVFFTVMTGGGITINNEGKSMTFFGFRFM